MRIVKDILNVENDFECEQYVNEIFKTIYAIGGDYSEKTLMSIARHTNETELPFL
ncbi:MAG: hypothetical protein IJD58_02240 [Lachnospiraceae bacterium]|nr:hypothetical protein [Lachnospiraceae bacterium]